MPEEIEKKAPHLRLAFSDVDRYPEQLVMHYATPFEPESRSKSLLYAKSCLYDASVKDYRIDDDIKTYTVRFKSLMDKTNFELLFLKSGDYYIQRNYTFPDTSRKRLEVIYNRFKSLAINMGYNIDDICITCDRKSRSIHTNTANQQIHLDFLKEMNMRKILAPTDGFKVEQYNYTVTLTPEYN
jgi:hypothetical protein